MRVPVLVQSAALYVVEMHLLKVLQSPELLSEVEAEVLKSHCLFFVCLFVFLPFLPLQRRWRK